MLRRTAGSQWPHRHEHKCPQWRPSTYRSTEHVDTASPAERLIASAGGHDIVDAISVNVSHGQATSQPGICSIHKREAGTGAIKVCGAVHRCGPCAFAEENAYSAAVAAASRNDGDVVNAIVVDVKSAEDLRRATSEGTICEIAIG